MRLIQGYFITEISYYELKWQLLGEWLSNGFAMYDETYDYTGPLAALVFKVVDWLFGRSVIAGQVLSSLVIIIQAWILNSLLLRSKVYDENGYLPAFIYVVVISAIPDFKALSPQLMSLTFVLLALRNVFRRIGNQVTDELFLSCGIYIGIASMIYLPAAIFLLAFLFSLILFSTAIFRRLVLYLFGFLLVFSACAIYYYLRGSLNLFMERAIFSGAFQPSDAALPYSKYLIVSAPFLSILLLSIVKKYGAVRLTNFQQKVEQVMWILSISAVAVVFVSNERSGHELIFFAPTLAYFWSYYFILLKRPFFKVIMPGILIFGLHLACIYNYLHSSDTVVATPSATIPPGTMILGTDIANYELETIKSPFLFKEISEEVQAELDTYEGVENFQYILEKTQPKRIIDKMEVMPKVLFRLPEIQEDYLEISPNIFVKKLK
ncbi:MAG: hypothetical protein AAF616_05280 [Bacteroidota bacterium]